MDDHVGLVGEGVGGVAGVEAVLAVGELDPGAGAVGVELGDVEGAFAHVLLAGDMAFAHVGGVPQGLRDELVDVFVARVVTHVEDDRLAGDGLAGPAAFVGEAAEGAVLERGGGGGEGVDLDDPAEGVEDVAVVGGGAGAGDGGAPAGVEVVAAGGVPQVGAAAAWVMP
jgi:hypothetical protein